LSGAPAFALFPVVWFMPNTQEILGEQPTSVGPHNFLPFLRWQPNLVWTLAIAVLFFAVLANMQNSSFLYFQF
jgi:hypothetical protein